MLKSFDFSNDVNIFYSVHLQGSRFPVESFSAESTQVCKFASLHIELSVLCLFINIYYNIYYKQNFSPSSRKRYMQTCKLANLQTASVSFVNIFTHRLPHISFSLKAFEEIRKGSLADERCCFSTILYCLSAAILVSDPTPAPPLQGRGAAIAQSLSLHLRTSLSAGTPLQGRGAATAQSLSSHLRTSLSAGTPLQGRGAVTAQSYPRTSAPPYPQALPSLVGEGQGWGQYSHNPYLPSNDSKVCCKYTQNFSKRATSPLPPSNKPSSSEEQGFFLSGGKRGHRV